MNTELMLQLIQTVGLGVVMPALTGWFAKTVRDTSLRDAISRAAERAGGIAYDHLTSRLGGVTSHDAKHDAIMAGVDYMNSALPNVLRRMGVHADTVSSIVRAELGRLLAADPTVSAVLPRPVEPLATRPRFSPRLSDEDAERQPPIPPPSATLAVPGISSSEVTRSAAERRFDALRDKIGFDLGTPGRPPPPPPPPQPETAYTRG